MKALRPRRLLPAIFSRPSLSRNFWLALVIAASVTMASVALYFVVLLVWSLWFGQPFLRLPELEPKDLAAAQMALAQTFTGFAAVFLTTFLGMFAIQEIVVSLEERTARPDVSVGFDHSDRNIQQWLGFAQKSGTISARISAYNDGNTSAYWYRIEIHLFLLRNLVQETRRREPSLGAVYAAILPAVGEWYKDWTLGITDKDAVILTFTSHGSAEMHPKWPFHLCDLRIPVEFLPSDYHIIPYVIVTNDDRKSSQFYLEFNKNYADEPDRVMRGPRSS
jgi:hypothetical protein